MTGYEDQQSTVNVVVGNVMMECFIAFHTFFEVSNGANTTFTEEHSHACYELLICKSGAGFQFVNNQAHEYADHSIFLFAPFTTHAHISSAPHPETRCSIRFEVLKDQMPGIGGEELAASVFKYLSQNGFFSFSASEEAWHIVELIADMIYRKEPSATLLLGGLLSTLFAYVFREINACASEGKETRLSDWTFTNDINRRKFLIDQFFDQLVYSNARMEDLCKQVHLSSSQLNRVIREMFGTTFKQKLIEVRIAYIKYFLKYSDMSISEIAQRTSFPEDSNFSLFFKQHCGLTPSQYRAQEKCQLEAARRDGVGKS